MLATDGIFAPLVTTQCGVSASVDISSDDECLVRPDIGRDVAARTAV